ncbi:MAG: VWA domain-containing protein [Spirochaetes bacterium]|nr:VWA domain-containing protein [Spirochaetota bacterium]
MKKFILIIFLSFFYFSCSFNNPFLPSALNDNNDDNKSKINDYLIIIDKTGSMDAKMTQIKNSVISFVTQLKLNGYDNRFALILFGNYPELLLNWTDDADIINNALESITYTGGIEAVLEVIRISINSAVNNTLFDAAEPLTFRENARKKILLFTDEYSSLPYYIENRFAGQTTSDPPNPFPTDTNNGWCLEITATADALINKDFSLYLFIDSGRYYFTKYQFSDTTLQFQNADYTKFDPDKTLDNLTNNGLGECLQAKLLKSGRFCRAININDFTSIDISPIINNVLIPSVDE